MIPHFFSRLTPSFVALTLAAWPISATADSHGSGSFAVVDDAGATLMALDLVETRGRITGAGVAPSDGLAHGPAVVTLRQGARLGDDLHLMLRLDAHNAALPDTNARLTVQDGATIRLLYNGGLINGTFQSVGPGSITIPDAPPEPVVAPTPAPAPAPEPAPETATLPPSCTQLDQVAAELEAAGDDQVIAELRNIQTLYGLAKGGAPTDAKCQGALAEINAFVAQIAAAPEPEAEACYAVAGAVEDIAAKETASGLPLSNQPEIIMTTAGMITPSNPAGADTADSCARALTGLYAYLDSIVPAAAATSDLGTGSIELPQGYRVEPIVNLNIAGDWQISAGGDLMALWSQGRSTLAYEKGPDQRRVVWFWDPRNALKNAGVSRGTLFLEGTRDRGRFDGEARHYVEGCGVFVYPVRGRVREQETTIRLTGERPQVDANCTITGLTEHDFRIEFVADNPPDTPNLNVAGNTRGLSGTPNFGVWALQYEVRNIDRGGGLNVRRNPATNARILGELPHNARNITILGEGCTPVIDQVGYDSMNRRQRMRVLSNRWCRVRWNDQTGWVYGRYLRPM